MGNMSEKIEHVVVLMLENRSFDSMLGMLYPKGPGFNGLSGNETNPCSGQQDVQVWSSNATDPQSMSVPDPDPGELWTDINMQLFGLNGTPGTQPPPMNGFVDNYVTQTTAPSGSYQPASVMHYYDPAQVPVISQLAKQFAVSDQWFASAPCQTWPNRFFLHCATAGGYENNSPTHFPYLMETVFNRFEDAGRPWKIYFHDFPQTLTLTKLWYKPDHFFLFDQFLEDAKNGNLPDYAFIEPRYFPDVKLPNDQHPPHNVGMGEELIAEVYNAVRNAPTWQKTLLIIIYDEHGGCYDHAPPPTAVPPAASNPQPLGFERYGVRVPAVFVSPYIRPGTVLRASQSTDLPHNGPPYPFDHTSVIATLMRGFGLIANAPPLSNRDAAAPSLEEVLNLDTPDNDGPLTVSALPYPMTDSEVQNALTTLLNDFQKGLNEAAFYLPALGLIEDAENLADQIEQHVNSIINQALGEVPANKTPADAVPFINGQLKAFFGW